jgi:hypothetical protein
VDPVVVPGHEILAHPVAVLAIPAFIPVVVVIVTVLWVARRDRVAEARELAEAQAAGDEQAAAGEDETTSGDTPPEPTGSAEPPEPRRRLRDRMPSLVIVDEQGHDHALRPRDPD